MGRSRASDASRVRSTRRSRSDGGLTGGSCPAASTSWRPDVRQPRRPGLPVRIALDKPRNRRRRAPAGRAPGCPAPADRPARGHPAHDGGQAAAAPVGAADALDAAEAVAERPQLAEPSAALHRAPSTSGARTDCRTSSSSMASTRPGGAPRRAAMVPAVAPPRASCATCRSVVTRASPPGTPPPRATTRSPAGRRRHRTSSGARRVAAAPRASPRTACSRARRP